MQRLSFYIFLFFILSYSSCKQSPTYGEPIEDPNAILKDQKSFLKYYNDYLKLSEDFIAFNSSLKVIGKGEFLQQLFSGDYLPLRLTSKDTPYYKLYKINTQIDDYIPVLIKSAAYTEHSHYQMEGKPLPGFNFVDIEGKKYNPATTKGKIVVLKFWFIHCQVCVDEIPALNEFVKQYENRNDIVFLSLAFDQEKDLKNFLSKTKLSYAVVANQKDYLMNDLQIQEYPTHAVINKKGMVVKLVNTYKEMESVLKKEDVK
jgi:peroxiredoxin